MRNDIKHGKELFKWLAPEQVAVLDEIEAQFATEFRLPPGGVSLVASAF